MSLQKGLIGHWPLDQESLQSTVLFADKTPHENVGTSANTPVFTTDRMGQSNRAMSFNGSSDYVDCGNDSSLDITTENFSISVWIKPNSDLNARRIVQRGVFDASGYILSMYNGRIFFDTNQSGAYQRSQTDENEFVDAEWAYVTIVRIGSSIVIYKNTIDITTTSGVHIDPLTNTEAFKISKSATGHYFSGPMADVRIYNRALSQQEITTLYESYRPKVSLGSLMKGLVLDMPLTSERYNPGNTKFDDLTPYENRGTNTGADVDTDHTTFIATNSDRIRIPDSESLSPTSTMTGMVWVKGAEQSEKGILSHYDIGTSQRSSVLWTNNDVFTVIISDNGAYTDHIKKYSSSIVAFDDTWHLVGFTFDAGTLKLFVDGVEDTNPTKTADDAITTIHNSTSDVMVGCFLNSDTPLNFFNGDISGAKMWNRALSSAEVLLLYEKGR